MKQTIELPLGWYVCLTIIVLAAGVFCGYFGAATFSFVDGWEAGYASAINTNNKQFDTVIVRRW